MCGVVCNNNNKWDDTIYMYSKKNNNKRESSNGHILILDYSKWKFNVKIYKRNH